MCFIQRADESRYGELLDDLHKGVHMGRNEYPKTVSSAYELLLRTFKQSGYRRGEGFGTKFREGTRNNQQNFVLAQRGQRMTNEREDAVPGRNGVLFDNILCYDYADLMPQSCKHRPRTSVSQFVAKTRHDY